MAPEPEDLIWENLQYTRAQRAQRIVLSTLIVIALTIVNCTAISVTQVWLHLSHALTEVNPSLS